MSVDDAECEHLLEAAALSAQLIEALQERDEARAEADRLRRLDSVTALENALSRSAVQADEQRRLGREVAALRAAIEPTETNLAIYASAIDGNWSFSGGEKEQARCVLAAIAARVKGTA